MINNTTGSNGLSPKEASGDGSPIKGVPANALSTNGQSPNGDHPGAMPLSLSNSGPNSGTGRYPGYAGDVVDLGGALATLWRRRRLMLTVGVIVFLLGALLTFRQPSVYQATCSILITAPSDTSPTVSDSLRDLLSATQPRSIGTQLAIMRSYPVQRAALKRLTPAEQVTASRNYKLDVQPERDSDAIDIIAESYDPQVAADLANALNTEYMWQYQQQNRAQVLAGTREVADQLAAALQRLNKASTDLKNYKQNIGTIDFGEESKARLGGINQIESTLRDLKSERAADVAQIQSLTGQIAAMPKVEVLPDRIVRRPELEALRGQLNQLELQRIATLRRYRPASPEIHSIDEQRAEIQKRLQSVAQTEVSSWTRSVNPIRQGLVQEIAHTQSAVWSIDARTQALQESARQEQAKEALLPEKEYRLNQLTNQQAVLQQTYQILNEKYQSLLVSEGTKLTTARTLAAAEAPPQPIRPRRLLSLIMSLMAAVALAVGAAIVVDHLDDRIRSSQGAEAASGLPVLAQIPLVHDESKRSLSGHTSGSSPLLESFRLLRTHLMLPAMSGPSEMVSESLRSVLISSSQQGEGKSFCALNLAIAMSLSGKRVVLIECDLRRPRLHSLLGTALGPGLSDVVAGTISLDDALQETAIRGLKVLTAGSPTSNSTELLDSEAARRTLRTAIAGADFAILNCPPVPLMADTQIVATMTEAALLVVGSEEANGNSVTLSRTLLERTGIRLLGIVLNKVEPPTSYFSNYLDSQSVLAPFVGSPMKSDENSGSRRPE